MDLEFLLALLKELLRSIWHRTLEGPLISFLTTGKVIPNKVLFVSIIKNGLIIYLFGKIFFYFCATSPLFNEAYEFWKKAYNLF